MCIVNPYEHGGGAEYQISQLLDQLAALGRYDVYYLAHFLDTRTRERNYSAVRVGDGGAIPRFGYLMEAGSLYRRLREIDPRIIYQRVACAYTGICAAYAQRHRIPLVWHVAHDTDVTPALLDPARNVVRVRLEKWAADYGARRARRVVVQTRHQGELLRRHFARSADAVIPNFHPPATEPLDKAASLTVLWIANLKPWKQPEVFVRLAQRLSTYREVRFIMVGALAPKSGNQGWQESLLREVRGTANLDYVGTKSHAEVNALLAQAHIFVNTSVHEGFPNTFIQAWLRDVVVVSLSVDPDQVLAEKKVGIHARSEAALVDAVRGLIDNPAVRAGYVERGRNHALAAHSLRNARDLVRLIDETANS